MPINCPLGYLLYSDCLDCRHRQGKECWANALAPIKLSELLTNDERLAILEETLRCLPQGGYKLNEAKKVSNDDYRQLKERLLLLEEKLNSHIDKTAKPKSSYA